MQFFSRVVFALVGLMLGPLVGILVTALVAVVLLRDRDGAPGNGIAIIFLVMVGVGLRAVLGLTAGLVVPAVCEQRQRRRKEKTTSVIADGRV